MTHHGPIDDSRAATRLLAFLAIAWTACDGGGLPDHVDAPTTSDRGARVVWDLGATPLPEIPLPNDVATYPDPTSPSGRRINASMVAPTTLESELRETFDTLDGWGTFAPITVRFDAPLDIAELMERQGGAAYGASAWPRHAIYLVDLETGEPVALDFDGGNFQLALPSRGLYFPFDPRANEGNLIFETVEEDLDGDGVLDPGEDTDFDGVLDHPNTLDGTTGTSPEATEDEVIPFYERETETLRIRPVVPLDPSTRYAVVLTDRLLGEDGAPVRSPFATPHHLSDAEALASLPAHFRAHADLYGDLADRGFGGVAFAWSFTTASVTRELDELRDGLYGRGRFAYLADEFSPDLYAATGRGGTCSPSGNLAIIPFEELRPVVEMLGASLFGGAADVDALLGTYDQVSHLVIGFFESPYLLGDPDRPDETSRWDLDALLRDHERGVPTPHELVPMLIIVPRETETSRQPFRVAFYSHGYTGLNLEALGFGGMLARNGIATVAIDDDGHGLFFAPGLVNAIQSVLGSYCLRPLGRSLAIHRARDLTGDGVPDSGGNFWSANIFHTRDSVRQSVLDHLQAIRILRHFGRESPSGERRFVQRSLTARGTTVEALADLDGDGTAELAGDFDANGVVDFGGWSGAYHAWGESLGGIISSLFTGTEPMIRNVAPTSGGGGLLDIGVRSRIGAVRSAVFLRTFGPFVIGQPSSGPSGTTQCPAGTLAVQALFALANEETRMDLRCLPIDGGVGTGQIAEGDVVVLRDLSNGLSRCAGVATDGAFRVAVPVDARDRLSIEIYRDAALRWDYEHCVDPARPLETPRTTIATFDRAFTFFDREFFADDPLESLVSGLGLRRQTPDFRSFIGLAQTAVEPGDPINYARRIVREPVTAPDATYTGPRSALVTMTVGDTSVPIATGHALGRAVGVLPFMPPDAPSIFTYQRTPTSFTGTERSRTPMAVLDEYFVSEGISRFRRLGTAFLMDIDDLGEGRSLYTMSGAVGGTLAPPRPTTPLRYHTLGGMTERGPAISGLLHVYAQPLGTHATELPNAAKTFDESTYYIHLIGRWFATDGAELEYVTNPNGHQCLEDASCSFFAR